MVIGLCGVQFCLWSYKWLTKTWFVNHKYNYRQNWTKQSPLTKLWQNLRKKLDICYTFSLEKKTINSAKCTTTACTRGKYCPYTQVWHVNCPITLSNYKHDACTVLNSCSNHALDNQSPLRILLQLWLKKLDYLTSQVPQWNTLIIRTRYKHLLFPWHTKYSCLMSTMSEQQRTQEHQTER